MKQIALQINIELIKTIFFSFNVCALSPYLPVFSVCRCGWHTNGGQFNCRELLAIRPVPRARLY